MKIALAGCSGSGKTTLAKALSSVFNVPIEEHEHPEFLGQKISTTRLLAHEFTGFCEPYRVDTTDMRPRFQIEVGRRKFEWEREHHKGFVTDRTHLDNLAYSVLHDINNTGTDPWFRHLSFERTKNYDVVLFLTMERFHKVGNDPARKSNPLYHKVYEDVLNTLITELTLDYKSSPVVITPQKGDTPEEIVEMIKDLVSL